MGLELNYLAQKGIVLIHEIGRDLKRSGKHIYRLWSSLALPPFGPEIITRLQNSIFCERMGLTCLGSHDTDIQQ